MKFKTGDKLSGKHPNQVYMIITGNNDFHYYVSVYYDETFTNLRRNDEIFAISYLDFNYELCLPYKLLKVIDQL